LTKKKVFFMMTFPKGRFTDFENAIIKFNTLNVRFHLVMTLFEDGPCDFDVAVTLLSDLLDDYQRTRGEFSAVFNALRSVRVFGALDT